VSRCRRAHRCWHTYSAPRQGGQRAGRAATSGRAGQVIVACRLVRRQAELQHAGAQAVTQLLPAACLGAGGCGRTVRSVPAVLDLPGRRGAAGLCGLCQQSSTSQGAGVRPDCAVCASSPRPRRQHAASPADRRARTLLRATKDVSPEAALALVAHFGARAVGQAGVAVGLHHQRSGHSNANDVMTARALLSTPCH